MGKDKINCFKIVIKTLFKSLSINIDYRVLPVNGYLIYKQTHINFIFLYALIVIKIKVMYKIPYYISNDYVIIMQKCQCERMHLLNERI